MKKIYIIAEAGVNHNGRADLAFKLVDAAVAAGADAVKFQTFRAASLVTEFAPKARYQQRAGAGRETQLEMLQRLELSFDLHRELAGYCRQHSIEFLSTAFDEQCLDFLACDLQLQTLKIPSGEINNAPLILQYARTGRALILSTGMATLGDIEAALGVIAFGSIASEREKPGREAFARAYASTQGQRALQSKVTLLHCTSEYPAPPADINLRAMDSLRAFGLPVGYSDHSEGIAIAIAAAARGAGVIEKHFTLDRTLEGPDHKASLEPDELKQMIDGVRAVEQALGNGIKAPRPSEMENMAVARKSLVAAKDIRRGEVFSADNLQIKRPGTGVSPMEYWNTLGKKAAADIRRGEMVHV